MITNKRTSTKQLPLVRMSLLGIVLIAPYVALSASPWSANGALWFLGMLPAVIGLFASSRLAFGAAVLTPTLMGLALLMRDYPFIGALYMGIVGAAVGLSSLRGWHAMGSFAAPLAAFALIGAPQVALPSGTVPAGATLTSGLVLVAFTVAGGLWTALIGQHITASLHLQRPPSVPIHAARYFAIALAGMVGVATFIDMEWLDSPASWWIILTLFVVVQPYYATSSRRVVARVIGTLTGAVLALLVVNVLHDYPLGIAVVALVITLIAPLLNMKGPYWVYVSFLTPAVVLQTAGGPQAIMAGIGERALYTVVGAVAAIGVLTIGHTLVMRTSRTSNSPGV